MTPTLPQGLEKASPVVVPFAAAKTGSSSLDENKPAKRFTIVNSQTILKTELEPLSWVLDGFLPEGFSVLAGRQKLGKSWLAMDWAVAVASGGLAMGRVQAHPGDVLYVDMENGQRRIKQRLQRLSGCEKQLAKLNWAYDRVPLNDGFLDAIDGWRTQVATPKLIVIDVLQRIKPPGSNRRTAYENDYACYAPLQSWAMENGVAILGLHHTRKGGAEDPLEALSGSNGLSAVADTTFVLDRNAQGTTLYSRGRDAPEKEYAMSFDAGLWSLKGDAPEVHLSEVALKIKAALFASQGPLGPSDVAERIGHDAGSVRQTLRRMADRGEIRKAARGKYEAQPA
jgi:RecA-family ATPase